MENNLKCTLTLKKFNITHLILYCTDGYVYKLLCQFTLIFNKIFLKIFSKFTKISCQ